MQSFRKVIIAFHAINVFKKEIIIVNRSWTVLGIKISKHFSFSYQMFGQHACLCVYRHIVYVIFGNPMTLLSLIYIGCLEFVLTIAIGVVTCVISVLNYG